MGIVGDDLFFLIGGVLFYCSIGLMYKKVSYEELIQLKTNFFDNLLDILKKEKGISREPFLPIKDYIATHASQGPTVYHINRQECVWKTTFVNPRE